MFVVKRLADLHQWPCVTETQTQDYLQICRQLEIFGVCEWVGQHCYHYEVDRATQTAEALGLCASGASATAGGACKWMDSSYFICSSFFYYSNQAALH